jgi:hypothetical protein
MASDSEMRAKSEEDDTRARIRTLGYLAEALKRLDDQQIEYDFEPEDWNYLPDLSLSRQLKKMLSLERGVRRERKELCERKKKTNESSGTKPDAEVNISEEEMNVPGGQNLVGESSTEKSKIKPPNPKVFSRGASEF